MTVPLKISWMYQMFILWDMMIFKVYIGSPRCNYCFWECIINWMWFFRMHTSICMWFYWKHHLYVILRNASILLCDLKELMNSLIEHNFRECTNCMLLHASIIYCNLWNTTWIPEIFYYSQFKYIHLISILSQKPVPTLLEMKNFPFFWVLIRDKLEKTSNQFQRNAEYN